MIKIVSYSNVSYGIKEFVIDTIAELSDVKDCEMGSTAFVIENATVYMKDGEGNWREI